MRRLLCFPLGILLGLAACTGESAPVMEEPKEVHVESPQVDPAFVAEIPFQFYDDMMFIKVKLGAREADFIFDTGAGGTVVDSELLEVSGVASEDSVLSIGGGGSTKMQMFEGAALTLSGLQLEEVDLVAVDFGAMARQMGRAVQGIIGGELLYRYVIAVDNDRQVLTFYDQEKYKPTHQMDFLPLDVSSGLPMVMGEVALPKGAKVTGRYLLDTGAKGFVILSSEKADEVGGSAAFEKSLEEEGMGISQTTFGLLHGRSVAVQMGKQKLENVPVTLSLASEGVLAMGLFDALYGNQWLKRFNTIYDYAGDRFYYEPNGLTEVPPALDGSGLRLRFSEDWKRIEVHRVVAGSPADLAGIKAGVSLVAVNEHSMKSTDLFTLKQQLQQLGKTVTVTVYDGQKEQVYELQLADPFE